MRPFLAATTTAVLALTTSVLAATPACAQDNLKYAHINDAALRAQHPSYFGDRQRRQRRPIRRQHPSPRPDPGSRTIVELRALRSDLLEIRRDIKRELKEVRSLMGSPAAVAATPAPSLSSYGLMAIPDVRQSIAALPEPVGPSTASLPMPDVPPAEPPIRIPVPSEHSRLAIGAGRGVHADLIEVLHEASRFLPEGYTARIESGKQQRRRGGYHPRGKAADVRIFDEHGKPLGWYQTPRTFRTYEQFAQAAKIAQMRLHPTANFVWGGYFRNRGPGSYGFADLMHMQWGGPMGGGSWREGATGITRKWVLAGGGESVGMAVTATTRLAGAVPVNDNDASAPKPRAKKASHRRRTRAR